MRKIIPLFHRNGIPIITTTTPPPTTNNGGVTTPSPTPSSSPTSPPTTTPSPKSTGGGLSAGASAGIAIGVILAVVGIAVGIVYATNHTLGGIWASLTGNVGGGVETEVGEVVENNISKTNPNGEVENSTGPMSQVGLLVFPQIFKVSEMTSNHHNNVGDYNTMNKREELKNRRDLTWKSIKV